MGKDKSEELAYWIVDAIRGDKLETFDILDHQSSVYDQCHWKGEQLTVRYGDGTLYKVDIQPLNDWYDSNFGDDKKCRCGHSYYRHFDTYEKMEPVGCKYCQCYKFI